MGNNIIVVEDIASKIRQRIQAEFVTLVPEEMWSRLVKKEIDWFLTDTGYRKDEPSPLKTIIRRQLEVIFIEKLKVQLNEMQGSWNANGNMTASIAVETMVKKIAPELWEIAVAGVIQKAIEGFRNSLAQY